MKTKSYEEEDICPKCGAAHIICIGKPAEFDNGDVHCLVCGNLLFGWSGPGRVTVRLKERGSDQGKV